MATMASKYAGKCKRCRSPYGIGTDIYWSRGTGAVCLACHGSPAPDAPRTANKAPSASGRDIDRFGSWGEFVQCAVERRDPRKASTNYMESFSQTKSWDEALGLALGGWGEIRPEVDALVDKIDADIAPRLQPAFQSYFDVSGGMVDVGRFLDGEPECMVETRLVEIAKPGKVIGILINGAFNCYTHASEIKKRGVAIVALIDSLEKLQHSTEIDIEISLREGMTVVIRVKNAADSLDIDMLMFAIAHPAAYRRIFFAYLEGHPIRKYRDLSNSNYGRPMPETTMGAELGASVVLGGMINLDADVWIRERLAEFGLVKEGTGV